MWTYEYLETKVSTLELIKIFKKLPQAWLFRYNYTPSEKGRTCNDGSHDPDDYRSDLRHSRSIGAVKDGLPDNDTSLDGNYG